MTYKREEKDQEDLVVSSSDGKVYIVSEYKHIMETNLSFKVFINMVKKIIVKGEPFFIVAGENELLQIFDISFKVVFTRKFKKDTSKTERQMVIQSIQCIQITEQSFLLYVGTRNGEIIEMVLNFTSDFNNEECFYIEEKNLILQNHQSNH